jgi:protein kinase-like protein
VNPVLDSPKVDGAAAVAVAVEALRDRGATCQAYIRTGGTKVCVNAVNAVGRGWPEYSEAASRRAAAGGRRMLPVLDGGVVDGRFWIAYDMGSATSLADHRGLLPTSTCLRVLSDVARALDEAGAKGVFASELPPDSIFLIGKGARLGDLGTAREGLAGAKLDLDGDPSYVPPEVLKGKRADERSGVYLFGALLHYLLTGTAPPPGRAAPHESRHAELPASIKAIVATTMADDPANRPPTVSEAHEMARRALRGEPPAPARKRRGTRAGAVKAGALKAGALKAGAVTAGALKAGTKSRAAKRNAATDAAKPRAVKAAAVKAAAVKAAAVKTAAVKTAAKPRATMRRSPRSAAARAPQRLAAIAITPRRVLAVGGAVGLGAAVGLLLGASPDPEPARAQTITSRDVSVTLPSGRHRVEARGKVLAVRAPGSLLRARIVDPPPRTWPGAQPVQLGTLQAWRRATDGVVRYSVPTSEGTLAVRCRTAAPAGSRPLELCERTASTLRLRDGRALPLAAAAEESRRLRTAIAALAAERDAARARLGSASTPNDQRAAAQDLADSHRRAATALRELTWAAPVEAAARGAADAYASLAASAESGSPERWAEATEDVRRSDAVLTEAIAAAG